MRAIRAALVAVFCCGCTDPNLRGTSSDLNYEFVAMDAHADHTLDVAVVNTRNELVARSRIVLPVLPGGPYPRVPLSLEGVLEPGNNRLQGTKSQPQEHVWMADVPASGRGTFEHTIRFGFFDETSYKRGQDLVLEGPELDVPAAELDAVTACIAEQLAEDTNSISSTSTRSTRRPNERNDERRIKWWSRHTLNTATVAPFRAWRG